MQRTLFLIPHEIGPLPIFGLGWALVVVVLGFIARLLWAQRIHKRYLGSGGKAGDSGCPPDVGRVLSSEGPFWIAAAALVVFVLPGVELVNAQGDPVGMAIRGYGVFLLLGIATAVGLAAYRTSRRGMDPDLIYSLAPWVFIGGIAGARLFYVIQYRDEYVADSAIETLKNVLAFTEGGLVVYGSFIGGFLAFVFFVFRRNIPMFRFGDAIVPCIFLGMFFGRLGCMLNGCCYGGRCEEGWASLQFPPLTAVYQEQLTSGELLGMDIDSETGKIRNVLSGSIADELGVEAGQVFEAGDFDRRPFENADPATPREDVVPGWAMRISGQTYVLTPDELPARALPVRAAQPISAVCSLVLCLVLCGLSYVFRRDGALMFVGFASYAVLRFVLEIVRVDEAGQFNTGLSISQWVSIFVLLLSLAGLAYVYRSGRGAKRDDEDPSDSRSTNAGESLRAGTSG